MKPQHKTDLPAYAPMIRVLRERTSLTQAQLASKLGVRANTVARWESAVSEPLVWNYWALHAFAYYRTEWDLADFFSAQIDLAEEHTKWDLRHLLRNLATVRRRAASGDEIAARILKFAQEDRFAYLRSKVHELIGVITDETVRFPEELNRAYRTLSKARGDELMEAYMSKKMNALIGVIREIDAVDLIREGCEWEALEAEGAELKQRQQARREKADEVRKRFELFRRQRKEAREIVKARIHSGTEASHEDFSKADRNLAQALGLEADIDTTFRTRRHSDGNAEE